MSYCDWSAAAKVVEVLREGLFLISDNIGVIAVNPAFEKMTGYDKCEILGLNVVDLAVKLIRPEDLTGFISEMESIIISDRSRKSYWQLPFTMVSKSRSRVPACACVSKIDDADSDGKTYVVSIKENADLVKIEQELRQSIDRLNQSLEGTIELLSNFVRIRDPYTAGHQRRVSKIACAIAKEMELPEDDIQGLRMAGLVHDIGKIAVPAEILSKPGKLTEAEFSLIKTHPQIAYEMLKSIEFPWDVANIVIQHHEKQDGSGYPAGLVGEEIKIESAILGIADVVEAMSTHRPYRPALGIDKALAEINTRSGSYFLPEAVEACASVFAKRGFDFDCEEDMSFRSW